ncbi:MAG: hypothetical protein V2I97_13240, partial [Desulfococcaceae bacterium]|nr:hypothetical protein [Desulfococcaceae bacterium]
TGNRRGLPGQRVMGEAQENSRAGGVATCNPVTSLIIKKIKKQPSYPKKQKAVKSTVYVFLFSQG